MLFFVLACFLRTAKYTESQIKRNREGEERAAKHCNARWRRPHSRRQAESICVEPLASKVSAVFDDLLPLWKVTGEQVKDVRHAVPDPQGRVDPSGAGLVRESRRITEK